MAWYLAPSLAVLRGEVNTRWPNRDKGSDGTIGDTAHQASTSDHNPNSRESVDAWDMDKDGVDVDAVIAAFQKHPSAHYWIWQRQIADRDDGWRRRPYSGSNPHDKHAHFSIRQSATAEQDTRPWGLLEDDMTEDQVKAAVIKGVHAALDQAATRSTPTGRQMGDDIAVLLRKQTGPLATELAALRSVVEQLAAAVAAGGGSVDTAAILAGVDAAVAAARADIRDAVADLGEGGAAQVRVGEGSQA